MPKQITEVTRRDVLELLSGTTWHGRLNEIEFLDRIYDLDELPSTDSRYSKARDDIVKHRVANSDWDDDWVFFDERFGLQTGSDEEFLRFLTEMLHPVVRPSGEAEHIARALNQLLEPDGYELAPLGSVSGRPVYKSRQVRKHAKRPQPPRKHFTEDVMPLVGTVAKLAELDGSDLEKDVLQSATPNLEEAEYDNWNGGTFYHTLTLTVPVEQFARLGDQVPTIETRIKERIERVLRAPDSHHVSAVVIQPSLFDSDETGIAEVIAARADRPIPQFWAPDRFRLFLSHVTSFKQRAAALRQELLRYHISGFVAHETIEPGTLWQREIEAALRTMDAMAALLTPDFHASNWTDQEIGWALGAGVYVLPIRRGADPYGFIGEIQGIQGVGKTVGQVAEETFSILLRQSRTRGRILEAVVAGFERSNSYAEARTNLRLIESAAPLPEPFLNRIEVAAASNAQISDSQGVPERVDRLIASNEGAA
jgi:hypothetical protein